MNIRLAIRTYSRGVLQSCERIEVSPDELQNVLPDIAHKHAAAMLGAPGHVEIEFLDEPNIEERFFRIGTDPSCMRDPMRVDLSDGSGLEEALRKWGRS